MTQCQFITISLCYNDTTFLYWPCPAGPVMQQRFVWSMKHFAILTFLKFRWQSSRSRTANLFAIFLYQTYLIFNCVISSSDSSDFIPRIFKSNPDHDKKPTELWNIRIQRTGRTFYQVSQQVLEFNKKIRKGEKTRESLFTF